jgi:hypothetical protein
MRKRGSLTLGWTPIASKPWTGRTSASEILFVQPLHDHQECACTGWSATTRNLPFVSPYRLLTLLSKFSITRAAGAKVIQPLLDICEPQLAGSNATKHCRVRTPYTLRI